MRYETFDAAGKGTVATATVIGRRPPIATQDALTIGRGQTVGVDPLANDKPGQQLDGSDATFDVGSLRFSAVQPGPGAVSPSGDSVTLPNQGVFTVANGRVTFVPDARSAEPVSVQYSVTDTSGVTATGTVRVAVDAPAPVVTHDVAVTTALTSVQLPGALNDTPAVPGHVVSFAGFVGRHGKSNLSSTLSTPQGSWSIAPDGADPNHGPVVFSPAWGFSGTVVQQYLARDVTAGGEAVSALTVTVRPGPTARPDTLATRVGVTGSTNPAANDTPGLRADGSASTFDPRWAVFPTQGQPAGGVVADNGKTLTLPGRGMLSFSSGTVSFRPQAGFHGFAGSVAYQVEDTSRPAPQRGIAVVGQLTVLVTSNALTATDDSATTSLNRPVNVAAAVDDDPGSTTTALRPVFPATGQPAGSVRPANGLTLRVPGQGFWLASTGMGYVIFTPEAKFAGTTAPVTYQISGAGGATATARLQVTVTPGAAAAPDRVTRPEDSRTVDTLLNDFPGRSADGRLGTLDISQVRFPADAQPAGSVRSTDGRSIQVPAHGSVPSFTATADPKTGLITVVPGASFHGASPVITYEVLSDVADSTGIVGRQYARSTLQVTFTGGDIVATNDHVTVRSGAYAHLLAGANDSPAPGDFPLDLDSVYYAATGQPAGSYLRDDSHGHDVVFSLVVPGEGAWSLISGQGQMLFLPDPGFAGTTSPVRYTVHDLAGIHVGSAAETVTVLPAAVPRADNLYTPQGVPAVARTLANDTPELDPDGHPYANADLVSFDPDRRPSGSTLTKTYNNTQLVVPDQGTYTIDLGTGDVRFVPDPTFRGTASAFYLVVPGGSSRFQAFVADVDPLPGADSATTTPGTIKRIRVLNNDTPGTPGRPLDPGSLRLLPGPLDTPPSTTSADGQIAIIPGRGLFAAAGDGNITFYPLPGVTGTAYSAYSVADVNGTKAIAGLSVQVG